MTWDEIYEEAIDKGFGEIELRRKDHARWAVREWALDKGLGDIEEYECPEDEIDRLVKEYQLTFDETGNLIKRYKITIKVTTEYYGYFDAPNEIEARQLAEFSSGEVFTESEDDPNWRVDRVEEV